MHTRLSGAYIDELERASVALGLDAEDELDLTREDVNRSPGSESSRQRLRQVDGYKPHV